MDKFWSWFCAPFDKLDDDLRGQLNLRYNLMFLFALLFSAFLKAVFFSG